MQIISTRRGASYTVGIITLLMVVIMLLLAILPAYRSITDQLKNNEAKLKYLQDLKTKQASMDDLLAEYNNNADLIQKFEAYYQDKPDNEMIVANFDQIAKNNNCVLSSLNFKPVTDPSDPNMLTFAGIRAQPFDVLYKGNLQDLGNVLKHLEDFPLAIKYDQFSYTHYKAVDSKVDVPVSQDYMFTLTLTGEYYFWSSQN
jgi:hypothetical protein